MLRGWDAIPSACCTPACWFCPTAGCTLLWGDDGGPGLTSLLLVDQDLVVGQLGLWLDVKQGGVVSQVLYTLQLILLHLMLKIQRVC